MCRVCLCLLAYGVPFLLWPVVGGSRPFATNYTDGKNENLQLVDLTSTAFVTACFIIICKVRRQIERRNPKLVCPAFVQKRNSTELLAFETRRFVPKIVKRCFACCSLLPCERAFRAAEAVRGAKCLVLLTTLLVDCITPVEPG